MKTIMENKIYFLMAAYLIMLFVIFGYLSPEYANHPSVCNECYASDAMWASIGMAVAAIQLFVVGCSFLSVLSERHKHIIIMLFYGFNVLSAVFLMVCTDGLDKIELISHHSESAELERLAKAAVEGFMYAEKLSYLAFLWNGLIFFAAIIGIIKDRKRFENLED